MFSKLLQDIVYSCIKKIDPAAAQTCPKTKLTNKQNTGDMPTLQDVHISRNIYLKIDVISHELDSH